MDPFELLKADHRKVATLFDELESGRGAAKLDTFRQIKTELELHTQLEETIFYPALEKPEPTHDLTLEAYEEHSVVKQLLQELSTSGSADDEWQAKAKVLRENVEHHVDEEENELFDKAEDALTSEELDALGDRMAAEKEKKQGPRPAAKKASRKKSAAAEKPGIISRIATVIGLGESKSERKRPAKKAAKKAAKKKSAASSSKASKKSGNATASKRAGTSQAAKRVGGKRSARSGSKKSSGSKRKGTSKKGRTRK